LLADYREDIRKYAEGMDQTRILNVFEQIPVQLSKDNKKFQITKVASGARFKDYRGCIEWLKDAGIINVCYCLNFPELPLNGNYNDTKYKLYFFDTGIFVAMLDEEDFFVRTKDYLLPVEVKAKRGTAKTLRTLIHSNSYPDIQYGIKFTAGNIGYSDNIYTFPYFCAYLLKDYLKRVNMDREARLREAEKEK